MINQEAVAWLDAEYDRVCDAADRYRVGKDDEADRQLLRETTWDPQRDAHAVVQNGQARNAAAPFGMFTGRQRAAG